MFCFCSNEMQPCRIWGAKQKLNPIANSPSPIANNPCLYTLHLTLYTLHPTPIIKFYLKNLQVRKFFTTFVPKLSVLSKYAANIKNN